MAELRKAIQQELKLERSVKGPYLLAYLRHFASAYRLEGGEQPRDMRVVGVVVGPDSQPGSRPDSQPDSQPARAELAAAAVAAAAVGGGR